MGNDKSKGKYRSPGGNETVREFFGIRGQQLLQPASLQGAWKGKLSEGLAEKFSDYLFRSGRAVGGEDLDSLCCALVEGSAEDQGKLLASVFGEGGCVGVQALQEYVSELVRSYLECLKETAPRAYASWVRSEGSREVDLAVVSGFLVRDVESSSGTVTPEGLERWLRESGFLRQLSDSVWKASFGLGHQLTPSLPTADKPSALLSALSALALRHEMPGTASSDWRLLYSSAEEAHAWTVMLQKVSGAGPTLVLIEGEGSVFGAYAPQSWRLCPSFYGDNSCFLFQLRPEMRVFHPTGYNSNFQYLNSAAATLPNGMGFGGQLNYFAFFLSSEFGPVSVSKSCTTFRGYVPLASESEFLFSRLEVWAVGEPEPVEENVRKVYVTAAGLAMERDPTASAILEMAGKTSYAKDLPPEPREEG